MATGKLTHDAFKTYAKEFVAASDRLADRWELKSIRHHGLDEVDETSVYLVKKNTQVLHQQDKVCCEVFSQEHDHLYRIEEEEDIEDTDPTTVISGPSLSEYSKTLSPSTCVIPMTIHFEYHVIYSISYEVPVLYFQATYENGKQLPLNFIWQLVMSKLFVGVSQWELVSQQEHPILKRPFYFIHPCHTAKVMLSALSCGNTPQTIKADTASSGKQVDSNPSVCGPKSRDDTRHNYLATWLSTFGSIVGLALPLEYTDILGQ